MFECEKVLARIASICTVVSLKIWGRRPLHVLNLQLVSTTTFVLRLKDKEFCLEYQTCFAGTVFCWRVPRSVLCLF